MSKNVQGYQVGANRAYLEKLFGGPIVENQTTPNITQNSGIVVQSNGDRVGLIFFNVGNTDCFISLDNTAIAAAGIKLFANGGSVTMDVTRDFSLPARAWYGSTVVVGTAVVTIIEVLRVSYTPPGEMAVT